MLIRSSLGRASDTGSQLLWAPVVDTLSHRRHWVVASQLLVGASMITISMVVETLLEDVNMLTAVFLVLYFFVATQVRRAPVPAWLVPEPTCARRTLRSTGGR